MVDIALTTAGQILSQNDPGALETVGLVRRIMVAPPPFWAGAVSAAVKGKGKGIAKVSDVNPYLKVGAVLAENQTATVLGVLAIPVIAFLLGRATA
jgi:hypothetical protein